MLLKTTSASFEQDSYSLMQFGSNGKQDHQFHNLVFFALHFVKGNEGY